MRKKSKLTKSVKDDIVQRRLQGKTLAEIGHESVLGKSTDQYVVDTHIGDVKPERPDYPAAFHDFHGAVCTALTCKNSGFDSEITAATCKHYQCSVDDLKKLCKWYEENEAIKDKSSLQDLENSLAHSQKQLAEANREMKAYEIKLKKARKEQEYLKRKNKQAEASIALLQKIKDGLSQKQQS